ncbi:hypothetical protein CIHG_01667 [Coccidioides immitis H538.4]|uniref:Uncharacterized protein n=1 Tax=Coccidioides immitis H538.4 TaxID=396776 RepID=A0A0J8U9U7_COCIT|nr:hypothetical protein CIHG_01667 [Coccidioides immitis H538.4]
MGASRLESQTSPGANQRRETGSRSGIIFENAPCKCYITAFPPPPVKGVDRSRSDSTDHWCLTEGPDHHSHQKVTARAVCPIPPKSSEDGANRTRSTRIKRIRRTIKLSQTPDPKMLVWQPKLFTSFSAKSGRRMASATLL